VPFVFAKSVNAFPAAALFLRYVPPVEVPPKVIGPVPLASIVKVSFALAPLDINDNARPPAFAPALIFKPVTGVAVLASTFNAGPVVPFAPTARAFADVDVIVCAALVIVLLRAVVPVTARAFVPIVAPPRASDVPVAAPRTGVTRVGDVENTRFVDVVPVVPAAVKPVILLKHVMLATEQFVPPFAVPSVPASVTAPVVAVLGVNPVVPALNEATVPAVVASVPLVGNVTDVLPVTVPVNVNAPLIVNAPPSDTALPPILPTVVANDPAVVVTSPVSAGNIAAGKVVPYV